MQLKIGDRVRGKWPYGPEDAIGTVVEVTEPVGMSAQFRGRFGPDPMDDGTVRVAWDHPRGPNGQPEWCYSYQSMVELLPEDFGSGDPYWWNQHVKGM